MWYNSDESEAQIEAFSNEVEAILQKKYPGCDYFSEPSTQGLRGGDFTTVTLENGEEYAYEFDWFDEMDTIFNYGPKKAAREYATKIINGIKDKSALN